MVSINEALKFLEESLKDVTDEAINEARIIVSYLAEEEPARLILSNKKVDCLTKTHLKRDKVKCQESKIAH